ncbi:hypothetical protein F444_06947, partial [Phytophthora nicotianae P1976]
EVEIWCTLKSVTGRECLEVGIKDHREREPLSASPFFSYAWAEVS